MFYTEHLFLLTIIYRVTQISEKIGKIIRVFSINFFDNTIQYNCSQENEKNKSSVNKNICFNILVLLE